MEASQRGVCWRENSAKGARRHSLMERPRTAKGRRRNPRFACLGVAGVQRKPTEEPIPAKVVNLSAGGCLIVLEEPHALTQDTTVELTFEVNGQPFRVWGKVRAVHSDLDIGLEFPLMSERVRRRLEDLIEQLIEDALTTGMRRRLGEKRRYPRIACSGSAGVQMVAGEPVVPARIVDLSAGGCLMAFDKPQKLTEDMAVELSFHVNHLPFRMRGQTASIRSGNKIGFRFPQLSGRTRRQLGDVMDELIGNIVKRFAHFSEIDEKASSAPPNSPD